MPALIDLSLGQLIEALRAGETSSRDLTENYLARIEHFNPTLQAFLSVNETASLKKADTADRQLIAWRRDHSLPLPPLLGLPIAVKDVICVAGLPCTCGSRILENFIPVFTATAVEHLLAAGMIVIGKTNTDEFAMGSSTENSAFGPTLNPWDQQRVPGGSSGGSAAAVAARLAPAALGTDTGGSVRHPASFCGVTALKPSYGRVSRYGLVAFGSSLDVIGAITRDVADAALIYDCIAGPDAKDATTMEFSGPDLGLDLKAEYPLHGLKIGIPAEYFIRGIQPEVDSAVKHAIASLESLGASLSPINLPHTEYALPVYYIIAPAEASANLARYDGIRYGERINSESMWDVFKQTRGTKFGAEVKRRIMLGTYALSAGYFDAYYGQAQKVRTLIRRDFEAAFDQVDLIAAPVTPTTAFRQGEHTDDPLAMYLEDIFTLPANLAGIPALAFPVGFDQNGLPIGMQLMGPRFSEMLLLQAGIAYQKTTNWHLQQPAL
jgi:aspartyl-tRNA(Asn)/glutamyl-tRNA(Gln) amidotransferase subunit A